MLISLSALMTPALVRLSPIPPTVAAPILRSATPQMQLTPYTLYNTQPLGLGGSIEGATALDGAHPYQEADAVDGIAGGGAWSYLPDFYESRDRSAYRSTGGYYGGFYGGARDRYGYGPSYGYGPYMSPHEPYLGYGPGPAYRSYGYGYGGGW